MSISMYFPDQNRYVRHLLGLYLTRKRLEQNLSLKDLATQLELSPQTYKRIECGTKKISDTLFEKIQTHLILDPADLSEISRIAAITYINDLYTALAVNQPL